MTLPAVLTEPLADRTDVGTVRGLAQDEPRLGFLPVGRRRMTACGVQPVASVTDQGEHFSLYGAVAPTTGASGFLALPDLNSRAFPWWWAGCAAAFPASLHRLVLDHGAGHKAKAVRWPAKVVPVFLPPSSPAPNPIERLWRDRKDQLADVSATTMAALSDALWAIIQRYAPATLHSLTSFPDFVHAVETVQKALYG
jgi:hypothetical protein